MTHTRRTHSQLPRLLPYPPPQSSFHLHSRFLDPPPISSHLHQPVRRRRLFHLPQQLPEILLVLLLSHSQPRLRHQVPERQRLSQSLFLPQQIRLYLPVHHLLRAVVSHQMVPQHHHQPPSLLLVLGYHHSHQRRLSHINPISPRVIPRVQLLPRIPSSRFHLYFFHRQLRFPPYHLHRLS
ncbi:hypothetical protein DYY66_0865 [Candidatus Nitrosotalea sp. FS]|nr:hypothetical protein [Candidatus Nitrosotalea sp. FS]